MANLASADRLRNFVKMILRYATGEEIKKGDRVLFHGDPGFVEFLATEPGPETDWYIREYGGGIMIIDKVAGSTFVSADQISEYERLGDLEFVSRGDASTAIANEQTR